jgi:dTDP-L-rhamnose 4-epimerase
MRVLVTGGAGFIGSHVVDELLGLGHDVRLLDVLHGGAHAGPPDYLDPRADLITGDVRDVDTVRRALDGVDAVCHQAAMVGLGVDFGDVRDYVSHNDLGTATLLLALERSGFRGRLVLASSMVVYGEGRYTCRQDGAVPAPPRAPSDLSAGRFEPRCPHCGGELEPAAVTEDAPLDPRNIYAATKVAQEQLCFAWARVSGAPVTALRYHNVYGPRMPRDTPYAGVASIFRSSLEAGSPARVFEDGGQLRDFVHVRDVAHANVLALTAPKPVPGAFNVCSGQPHTILEMATALSAAHPHAPPPVVTGEFRLGDVRHVFASPARARELLGFTAAVGFNDGMREFATAPLRLPSPLRPQREL